MSRKASPTLVGAFVLGAVSLGLGGIVLLGSKDLFREKYPFVAYFEQSVNGLREGAPVKFKGVVIGSVDDIRLPLRSGPEDSPIAVHFSLDAAKLRASPDERVEAEDVEAAVEEGLRVRLDQESFVTGLLYVSIVHVPDSVVQLHEPIRGVPEIPTVPTELEAITGQVRSVLARFEKLDLVALADDLQATVRSVRDLFDSDELRGILTSLDRTLLEIGGAAESLKNEIGPLGESLRAAGESFRLAGEDLQTSAAKASGTLDSVESLVQSLERRVDELSGSLETTLLRARTLIDPSAPPLVRLEQVLGELDAVARAARAVLELLERDPAALVRGRSRSEVER